MLEIVIEFVLELAADLIDSHKILGIIRYIIVTILGGFIVFIGIMCIMKSPFILGKIFGALLAMVFLVITMHLYTKITKDKKY